MSKFTTTLYDMMQDVNEDMTGLTIDEKIDNLAKVIFDFNYPTPSDADKKRIENAIIKHYLMREIAFETVGLFKLKLNDRLNLIMPKYNLAYKNLDNEVSPYINNYIKETSNTNDTRNSNITTNGTNNANSSMFETTSDTPQGILTELKEGKYSSGARATTNEDIQSTTGTTTNEDTGNSKLDRNVESLQGITSMEAFRLYFDNLISLDQELVYEFSDLFMVLFD